MTSGKIAAEVISEALKTGNTSAKFLSKYESIWKKDFGKDIKLYLQIQNRWLKQTTRIIKLLDTDKKLLEMAFDIVMGNKRVHTYKFKILRRVLYLYIRNFFKLKK